MIECIGVSLSLFNPRGSMEQDDMFLSSSDIMRLIYKLTPVRKLLAVITWIGEFVNELVYPE